MKKIQAFFLSPYTVMSLVLCMYAAKVFAKLTLGARINSPVITGDGYHNASDIAEALMVILTMLYANRGADAKYPFGRKNVESIFELVVGGCLCLTALKLGLSALGSLYALSPLAIHAPSIGTLFPAHEPLLMGPQYLWWVLGTIIGSIALSFGIGQYQIFVGKRSAAKSLVADGKETLNDGLIEMTALGGIVSEYLFNLPIIEYPLGIAVAVLVFHAGYGMCRSGWNVLMQHSIGTQHETEIRRIAHAMPGVVQILELKVINSSRGPDCIMKIATRCGLETSVDIKEALAAHIAAYLKAQGFATWDYYIRFVPETPQVWREAYALIKNVRMQSVIAPTFEAATHIAVIDMENGRAVRRVDSPLPANHPSILALLQDKHVRIAYTFTGDELWSSGPEPMSFPCGKTVSFLPEVLGIE